jgi:hypothetical protein
MKLRNPKKGGKFIDYLSDSLVLKEVSASCSSSNTHGRHYIKAFPSCHDFNFPLRQVYFKLAPQLRGTEEIDGLFVQQISRIHRDAGCSGRYVRRKVLRDIM